MKDDDTLPVSTPTSSSVLSSSSSSSSGISKKDNSSDISSLFRRGRYKFWALTVILLLAFWSMLTGTVTLRWSAGDLNRVGEDYSFAAAEDLDVLDLEEREKLVKHMWDVHTNSQQIGLGGFWQEAFVAAYEDLTSEVPAVREAAISEIARMSVRYVPHQHSSSSVS
ncbi:hypothetical protein PHJA_000589000 [Phtheirospermum japonicum]|uniref:Uncharacterized protein n=1 Tax=Phtheirospermum japonicum TaxID=374723 RepID=A0A830BE57_9LAMI|nr:hypothetical protein PHJA_000589000 [Phtheirospermum japonicum]